MLSDSWNSYPSIFALGHRAVRDILDGPTIQIEEKVDGSQFSFGRFGDDLRCRSKNSQIVIDEPDRMFAKGVEYVKSIKHLLPDGLTFSGEYLMKPKHNALAYARIPRNHIIIFDIRDGDESYLPSAERAMLAAQLDLEVVPILHTGPITSIQQLQALLQRQSVLGGPNIEGVVVKDYTRFSQDKKALMGKYVSEAFKEVHSGEWRKANPTKGDVIQLLIERHRTPARWMKAVGHLRDAGTLTESPADIGPLMREVVADVLKEEEEAIKKALFAYGWKHISRGVVAGLAEWYKLSLIKEMLPSEPSVHSQELIDGARFTGEMAKVILEAREDLPETPTPTMTDMMVPPETI